MAAVDAHNSAIPGAIHTKMGEDLSEMWPNRHVELHADRQSSSSALTVRPISAV